MEQYSSYKRSDRDMKKLPSKRRSRCGCGCKMKATHLGTGQGAGMMSGCELSVRRWVRDGATNLGGI